MTAVGGGKLNSKIQLSILISVKRFGWNKFEEDYNQKSTLHKVVSHLGGCSLNPERCLHQLETPGLMAQVACPLFQFHRILPGSGKG